MTQPKMMPAPCACCPFTTNCSPDYMAAKNSTPEQFIGQAYGPFMLPCHMPKEFDEGKWVEGHQCAGAAHFRANVGVAQMLPEELGRLPPSDKAFRSSAEFLAYQKSIPIEEAIASLQQPGHTILDMVKTELGKQKVKILMKLSESP